MATDIDKSLSIISPPRIRLRYIDGLRGIAAFVIVLHHTHLRMVEIAGPSSGLAHGPLFLLPAHCMVTLFVVLSGYSLMLSVVRSNDYQYTGGLKTYAARRCRRILPAYYAALFFSLLPLLPGLLGWPKTHWQSNAPVELTGGSVWAHLLLIQNLRADWAAQINAPLWSIATEWQLYFLFPLLLLPVWRRFGSVAAILVGLFVGLAAAQWIGWRGNACPWYLGAFAMGMTGASLSHKSVRRCPWGMLSLALFVSTVALSFCTDHLPLIDSAMALASMILLIKCSKPSSALTTLLESKVLVGLGVISYSLYLIHQPLVTITATCVQRIFGNQIAALCIVPCVAVPISILSAILFHFAFERPFMIGHLKTEVAAAISAAVEPAI